jgi:hypothetical protein
LGVLQNPRPGLLDPAVDGALVAFGGLADRALDRPAKPMVQQGPQVGGMVTHPGQPLDHGGDAVQRPQLTNKPVGRGALEQDLFDPSELAVRQAWCGSGRPSARRASAPPVCQRACQPLTAWRETPSWRATSAWRMPMANSSAA